MLIIQNQSSSPGQDYKVKNVPRTEESKPGDQNQWNNKREKLTPSSGSSWWWCWAGGGQSDTAPQPPPPAVSAVPAPPLRGGEEKKVRTSRGGKMEVSMQRGFIILPVVVELIHAWALHGKIWKMEKYSFTQMYYHLRLRSWLNTYSHRNPTFYPGHSRR